MKIQVSDQNPSQELCLGAAMQVVSCDTATKIIAQVHEEELYSKIKGMNTSLKTTVEQLTANLTSKELLVPETLNGSVFDTISQKRTKMRNFVIV